ncbi:nitrilase family protein [Pontibacter chinhatensis]|uniref:Predicted amidohydrolase n=1 Tax=Pontibacter chinhatensis TaxID=1436961 RepID=A0A1I2SBX1_9BACT|nr:nitrilase family protein [Pontibacter chinhatensis]SFG50365.1 Predicted amidohydrolase [Pontibacter chinhatensis]
MEKLKIATAQFENFSGDKAKNLAIIEGLAKQASEKGADVIAFHECSVHGYTFARKLSKEQILDLAEFIPESKTVAKLQEIAKTYKIHILAGFLEKDENNDIYKAHVCVNEEGLVAKHRKLHPFINPHIKPGNTYCIFEIKGWKCGILICYDNNVIENVRATKLLGADIIFMPHVTMCTPSTRPGAGFVDPQLWYNRENDPTSLKLEFEGMKGRAWLMKWLPSRAYDNGIYVVFSNPIGMDDDQLKNGCSMIIDPYGDVVAECTSFENEFAMATLNPEALKLAGGNRYATARRPELYKDIIGQDHKSDQKVVWMK